MRIWRISNFADLSGRGGTVIGGRWHSQGRPIVYCTDHPSTALLETLVHVTPQTVPETFQLIEIDVPDDVEVLDSIVPDGWDRNEELTRRHGDDFLAADRFAIMKVPSVVMPKASNYLLNPLNAQAAAIAIVATYRYPFDSRLIG